MTAEVKKKERQQQCRNVCYTSYILPNMGGDNQVYNIYGEELCPTTNRLHYQGYVEFKRSMTLGSIKKSLGNNEVHIEARKGTQKQAIDYCKKDGKFIEWGEAKKQGDRSDLQNKIDKIYKGELKVADIVKNESATFHQYGRTLDRAEDLYLQEKKRNWMTEGIWVYGPTGCGKSHWAYSQDKNPYVWCDDKGWQDGYSGEETIIIDDFRGDIPYNVLLKMIDKYEYRVSRRGRRPMPLLAKKIIITSPLHPSKVYVNLAAKDSLDQLYRRIKIIEMTARTDCTSGQEGNTKPLDLPNEKKPISSWEKFLIV